MGFSWGGYMSVVMSSELVQERLGKDVPKPVAFAAFYPTCSILVRSLVNRRSAFYNADKWMSRRAHAYPGGPATILRKANVRATRASRDVAGSSV